MVGPSEQVSNYFVRERKKAGYVIKARHGLHSRRGRAMKLSASKAARPEVVVTHVEEEEQEDLDAEDDMMDIDVGATPSVGGDDLPELGFDDARPAPTAYEGYASAPLVPASLGVSAVGMQRDLSNISAQTSSTGMTADLMDDAEEDSELASPPFEPTVLPNEHERPEKEINEVPQLGPGEGAFYAHAALSAIV